MIGRHQDRQTVDESGGNDGEDQSIAEALEASKRRIESHWTHAELEISALELAEQAAELGWQFGCQAHGVKAGRTNPNPWIRRQAGRERSAQSASRTCSGRV